MRVFMLGWEFPPFISGGLGTACYGLTKAMSGLGTDIVFVLPRPVSTPFSTHVRLVSPHVGSPLAAPATEMRLDEFENVTFRTIDAQITDPYQAPSHYEAPIQVRTKSQTLTAIPVTPPALPPTPVESPANTPMPGYLNAAEAGNGQYAGDMFAEVQRYASLAAEIAKDETIDVVHAHDWMTFPAAMAVAASKNVPLVVHIHSTEFDRSGVHVDQRIYDIERRGMHAAMKVIAVSSLTKNLIMQHYGIEADKIEVVYNAIDINGPRISTRRSTASTRTRRSSCSSAGSRMQKGPEYFIAAAKKVLEVMDNVKFVMAGSGDMVRRTDRDGRRHGYRPQGAVHRVPARAGRRKGLQDGGPLRDAQRERAVRHRAARGDEPRRAGDRQQAKRRERDAQRTR